MITMVSEKIANQIWDEVSSCTTVMDVQECLHKWNLSKQALIHLADWFKFPVNQFATRDNIMLQISRTCVAARQYV